ncbi:MAG: UDP-N-acetylmuramoyl-tripeptide--D-alanyl-D-alanine ligase, partial [Firmicutes bacterium]|nr:UDP-N-acetylmuramoyl-tripeptide--D-alanyl-D-alanine ligase [Bacillota bacterium]
NGLKVIDDTYNAAPDSMKSAVNTLMSMEGQRKIAILGGMNELGSESAKYHKEVGAYAGEKGIDLLITIGEKAFDIGEGARAFLQPEQIMHFEDKEQLYPCMDQLFSSGDVILAKASRTMEFERIVEKILNE